MILASNKAEGVCENHFMTRFYFKSIYRPVREKFKRSKTGNLFSIDSRWESEFICRIGQGLSGKAGNILKSTTLVAYPV